jgi:hypothetical protein
MQPSWLCFFFSRFLLVEFNQPKLYIDIFTSPRLTCLRQVKSLAS